jgi:hypothetical protein
VRVDQGKRSGFYYSMMAAWVVFNFWILDSLPVSADSSCAKTWPDETKNANARKAFVIDLFVITLILYPAMAGMVTAGEAFYPSCRVT